MAGSAVLELTLGRKGYEVVGDLVFARRKGRRHGRERKKTVGFDGGRHGSECAVVSGGGGGEEAAESNGRGQRTNYREEVSGK